MTRLPFGVVSVTLDHIARVAGVSKSTVSRALNDDRRISGATKKRVRDAAVSSGYRGVGRGAAARSMTAALLISDPIGSVEDDLFFSEVVRGIAEQLETQHYHVLVSTSDGELPPGGRLPSVVHRADGVIAGGVRLQGSLVRALIEGPVPSVFIGRYLRGREMNAILPDNQEGGRIATEHLLSIGRDRVAFLGGPPDTNVYKDRLAGYRQAFDEAGRTVDELRIQATDRTAQGGFSAAMRLLDQASRANARPDAIFAADDWIALGVLRALRQRHVRVPGDIALVGYSDISLAAIADPPLSTVHVPKRRMGRTAAKLLLDLVRSDVEGPVQLVVSPHLVVRESTGGAPS